MPVLDFSEGARPGPLFAQNSICVMFVPFNNTMADKRSFAV